MKIKNVIIGIAILILTMFVTIYGINTFYPRPEYNDYCSEVRIAQVIETEADCIANEGKWNPQDIKCVTTPCPQGYCDVNYYCNQDYEDARETWTRNVFIIAVPLGIIIIALGAFLFNLEAVAAGLMGGGVGTLLYGTWGFFWQSDDKVKFIISLIGLIIVIGLAYYFNKKFEKKGKKK